jgi:hypothetical protein
MLLVVGACMMAGDVPCAQVHHTSTRSEVTQLRKGMSPELHDSHAKPLYH